MAKVSERESRDEKPWKMLISSEVAEDLEQFHIDLEEGKVKVGWRRFLKAIRWLNDPDKIRGWTRVFQLCRENPKHKRTFKKESLEFSMLPWENRHIWQPFIVDVYTDLTAKLNQEGDILSIMAFLRGAGKGPDRRDATGLFDFIQAKAKRTGSK